MTTDGAPIFRDGARFLRRLILAATISAGFAAAPVFAGEPIEIFDAHMHYNWEPKPFLSTEEALALFKKSNVTGVLATSRPNTGTHALVESNADELWVVPFIRPYRVRSDIATWMNDPFVFDLVREEYRRGFYRGIGEFHLAGRQAATAEVKRVIDFSVDKNLYLHCHCDAEALEILFSHNSKARIIWAHTGFALDVVKVRSLIEKYSELWGELSYRSGITDNSGHLTAAWRDLFESHPDRFMLGSDTWVNERWASYGNIMDGYRQWLAQLPPDAARKIAHENAKHLFAPRLTTQ